MRPIIFFRRLTDGLTDMELEIMQNPYNGLPLQRIREKGRDGLTDDNGAFFPMRNGYPNFLAGRQLTGLNQKIQKYYDRSGRILDLMQRFSHLWNNPERTRAEYFRGMHINPGDRVLEVSVGAGCNIRYLPKHGRYFGLDISGGMLDRCLKNIRRWGLNLQLAQANAEYLPYRDGSFDCVFHTGGINFFNDRERAIREMIRVAKPGARITIIDATEKEIKRQYRNIPFISRCISEEMVDRSRLYAPAQFVPEEIRDVEVKLINDGAMYRLSFVKPIRDTHKMFLLPNA